jgi:hypothetical protein
MALSVDYLYKFSLALIKKNMAGGLKSTDFARHWNDAQGSYQDDLLGRFQAKSTGKSGANTGLIQNETILTKLSPFITPVTLTIAAGQSNKPADFVYTLALRINNAKVFEVNHDAIWAMLDDVIDPPLVADDSYYYVEYQGYYKFFPNTVKSADLDYIATPTDVFWNFTLDANNRQVYSAGGSTQPQWDNNSCREITKRMLTNLGVGFKDQDFANFGAKVQMMGE